MTIQPNRSSVPALLLPILALILSGSGCSKEGSVRVMNTTAHSVTVNIMQSPDVRIAAGQEIVETVKISKGIFPPNEREIEVSGRGVVANPFTVRLVLKDGEEGVVAVEASAAALVVINELECSTAQAQVKGCGVGQWGANRLSRNIRPESSTSLRLDPGCYDVALVTAPCPVDPFRREYFGIELELGQADTIRFRFAGIR